MMQVEINPPFEVFTDVDGNPLEDGYIFIGLPSVDPESNPASVFFDSALSVPAAQPIRTKGGYPSNAGAPSRLYVGIPSYSFRLKNKNSFTIYSDLFLSNPYIGGTLQDALNEAPPVTIASAASVAIGAAAANTINVSGTVTITSFDTAPAGARRLLKFLDALTLTHSGASLILPNAANLVTIAGDALEFISLGSGNWECVGLHRRTSNAVSLDVLGTNGMVARTAAGAVTARTIAGTASEITVTNGDGVAGAPTISFPAAMTFAGKTIANGGAVTTVDINGGTVDGVVIGGSSAAAATFTTTSATTATVSTSLNLTGGQIAFPAVQVPSADANTLDDYEEGTWTPTLTFATPGDLSVVYSARTGDYTKIGRHVFVQFQIATSTFTHTTASGAAQITGLPFAQSGTAPCGAVSWQGVTRAGIDSLVAILTGSTVLFRISQTASSIASLSATDMPTGGAVEFTVTLHYHV